MEEFFTFDVVYIGQSYGQDGKRKAIDRLTGGHKTVERILSEMQDFSPNRSVGFITIDQQMESVHACIRTGHDGADLLSVRKLLAEQFTEISNSPLSKTTVDAAEAALIAAFQPKWNVKLKDFPQTGAPALLKKLKEQGYTHLYVHIDLKDALAKVRVHGKPSSQFSWRFDLDNREIEDQDNMPWHRFNLY
ncbi:hypothetical protein LK10_10325 [Sinomonas humi]|uniref:Uncharacterized protein n=1 Tax=Sinomonas humi TaxID=1338436 RepID=A0A0B2AHV9_9MICC|nr:hypothetical protein LK10_10325 [Sinomonas humi]